MKKTVYVIFTMVILLLLCSCSLIMGDGGNESILTESREQSEPLEVPGEVEADLIEEKSIEDDIAKVLEKYTLVLSETFGVGYDQNISYYRLYAETDTDYINIVGMISADDTMAEGIEEDKNGVRHYAGYAVDPSYSDCYVVLDHYSIDDIRKEFSNYMSDEVFRDYLYNNFIEYGGFVYLIRGGKGYGTESFSNPEIKDEKSDEVSVEAERFVLEEADGKYEFVFSVDAHRDPIVKLEKVNIK